MGQIITTQNLVAIKVVRHAGQIQIQIRIWPQPCQRLYFSDRKLSSVNIVLSPQGPQSFLWWTGTICYTHTWASLSYKCFICNAILAITCTNTWSLIIAYIIVHVISMIFQITEYLFMPTYFITFLAWQFMLTSVWYTSLSKLTQADPHIPFVCPQHGVSWYQDKTVFSDLRPTCTLTHWGLVTVWQQNFGHHCFNQWPVPSMVPSECLNQLLYNIN